MRYLLLLLLLPSLCFGYEIKQSATPEIDVILLTAANADVTGCTTVSVYYTKNSGAETNLVTPTVVEVGSVNMPALYQVLLTTALTDTVGPLVMYVKCTSTASANFRFKADIVANIQSDAPALILDATEASHRTSGTMGKKIGDIRR